MASPTNTAQNSWQTPSGEDFLQLRSSQGQNILGGIDPTGKPFGALASGGVTVPVTLTSTGDAVTPLTLNPFDITQTAPLISVVETDSSLGITFTSLSHAGYLGFISLGPDGLGLSASTDGDVTEAVITISSENVSGITLENGAEDFIQIHAGVVTIANFAATPVALSLSGKLTSYNGQTTANGGIPILLPGPAKLTAQSAAKAGQLVFATGTTPGAGMYRISYVATVTTADTTSLTLGGATGFQVIFTNANGDSVVKTSNPTTPNVSSVNATGTTISGCVLGYAAASTNINYNFGYTAGTGNFRYDLAIFIEFLGA